MAASNGMTDAMDDDGGGDGSLTAVGWLVVA